MESTTILTRLSFTTTIETTPVTTKIFLASQPFTAQPAELKYQVHVACLRRIRLRPSAQG